MYNYSTINIKFLFGVHLKLSKTLIIFRKIKHSKFFIKVNNLCSYICIYVHFYKYICPYILYTFSRLQTCMRINR